MIDDLSAQLRRDEGERSTVYQDHLGFWTLGVGRLVDGRKKGAGLRPDEIAYLLRNDINDRIVALTKALPWFATLDAARQGALVNMAFQMGTEGLLQFTTTLGRVSRGDYVGAGQSMLDSKWATQTPERAKRLSKQMETGVWQ